ncbi:MAG TPA: sugar ABC transporter substrate-binding protein [Anaerovoracaceae bacterium]|nr:sugar ABC transporter substrate-binding protein [Anaerovoracaceae bacterium]
MKGKNQKFQTLTAVLLVVCLIFAVGCTPAPESGSPNSGEPAESAEEGKIVIGLSEPSSGWPYISAYMRAFEAAAAKNPDVTVHLLSADGDIQKQANDIDDLIVQQVDILLVCSLDGTAIVPSLAKAKAAGIPILAVSNEPNEEGQALLEGFSGPDDKEQGRIAARIMAEALDNKGNIVIVEGTPGQSTTLLRSDGFREELEKIAPEMKILAAQPSDWDPAKAKSVAQAFITKYGTELDGIFSQDDNTAAAVGEVVRDAQLDKNIIIVGTGGSKNGINAIRSGLIYGTMMQSPTIDAEQGLELALKIVSGEKLEQKRNIIPMPIVTPENATEYEGEW